MARSMGLMARRGSVRYLDPALTPTSDEALLVKYAKLVGAEYDKIGVPLDKLRAGDVVISGPWSDWSWLPPSIGIEIVPDNTPPANRVEPIVAALHARNVPVGFRTDPPKTERSQYWVAYHEALDWVANVASLVNVANQVEVKERAPSTVVTDVDEARRIIAALHGKPFAFDFETDGLDVRKVSRIGLALADDRHAWWLIDQITPAIIPDLIKLLTDPTSEPRASGSTYDLRVLAAWTKWEFMPMLATPVWDTQVMHWLWSGGSYTNDLKSITKKLLKRDVLAFDDVGGPEEFWNQTYETQALYAASGDARNSYDLVDLLKPKLAERGVLDLYVNVEQPVTPVLAEMELAGLPLDRPKLLDLCVEYDQRLTEAKRELVELGFTGSVTKDTDIGYFLHEQLKLPVLERTPAKQQPRVATDVLRQLSLLRETNANVRNHLREINLFIEISEVDKALNTFLLPPLESMSAWLRASVRQTSVVTGRISTSSPNIMNIPSRAGKRIRQIVIAPDGCILVDSDYSTLEPRVGAQWSRDPAMIRDFVEGRDVYISLAADMGLGQIKKGDVLRDMVKIVYLADLYGTSPVKIQVIGLKSDIYIQIAQAREIQLGIHKARPEYYAARDGLVRNARISGVVRDFMFNRWKPSGALNAVDPGTRDAAARGVMNFPNQAGAGGIIKGAMPAIQRLYKEAGGTLCNQIHDELLGWVKEMPESQLKEFIAEKERLMCWFQPYMDIPLKVESGYGHTWYDAKQ